MKPGDNLWIHEHAGTLMRVQMTDGPERLVKLDAERLQESMDRAAVKFADPTRPQSPTTPHFDKPKPVTPPPRKR